MSYLPPLSFLPVAHVSKRFKDVWIQYKTSQKDDEECNIKITNPLALGHLFERSWFSQKANSTARRNKLNRNLLAYFVRNGYGKISANNVDEKNHILRKVMLEAASRGDIEGMWFMACKEYFHLNDEEICTMAGAAGQLEALKWLRGEKVGSFNDESAGGLKVCCPWDPSDVHREAAENSHDHVMEYVEKNCKNHEIHMHYGVGLPW